MKIVSTSYTYTAEFSDPEKWLERINFHTGILDELAKHHEVDSIEQINYTGKLKRNGVQYHFLNYKKKKLYFPVSLHRHIKKIKPDVVFVNGFIFPLQTIQLRLILGRRVKIIVINHAEKPVAGIRKFLQQQADRFILSYFFTSKEMGAAWVQQGIIANEQKITEVMEASSFFAVMDKEKALGATGVNGSLIFLWVGRLDKNKDPLTVVKGFLQFLQFQPMAKLYMIYQTEELLKEINNIIQAHNKAGEAIELVGKIPHGQLQNWYNAADFIISGSHYEGSGIAVCEAMSCGCIPILTNIPSFRKMTGRGNCGFLYEPGSDAGLLKALLQTVELNIENEKTKVLEQFKAELSFEAIAKKINTVINSL
jgi:glycosyltransferase involved in cell wall biosynthesis